MKKLWSYLAVGFAFMSLGIIIGAKYLGGADYSIEIAKIKNKRTTGTNSVVIPIEFKTSEKPPKKSKAERKSKRKERRLDRKSKKK